MSDARRAEARLPKPSFGDPCNGCGLCCIAEPCKLAVEVHGPHAGPCRSLRHDGQRHHCGMFDLATSEDSRIGLMVLLGIGQGCDSDGEWPIAAQRTEDANG